MKKQKDMSCIDMDTIHSKGVGSPREGFVPERQANNSFDIPLITLKNYDVEGRIFKMLYCSDCFKDELAQSVKLTEEPTYDVYSCNKCHKAMSLQEIENYIALKK